MTSHREAEHHKRTKRRPIRRNPIKSNRSNSDYLSLKLGPLYGGLPGRGGPRSVLVEPAHLAAGGTEADGPGVAQSYLTQIEINRTKHRREVTGCAVKTPRSAGDIDPVEVICQHPLWVRRGSPDSVTQ